MGDGYKPPGPSGKNGCCLNSCAGLMFLLMGVLAALAYLLV